MTYTNDAPSGIIFTGVGAPIRAEIEIKDHHTRETALEQDIEVTLPYKLRPEFGFAGKTIPLKRLVQLMEEEGKPLTTDRDMTLRVEARDQAMREDGSSYEQSLYVTLPPEAAAELDLRYFGFDTGYVLHLVANNIEEDEPERAARMRYAADKYYPDEEDDGAYEPGEEELADILGAVEEMVASYPNDAQEAEIPVILCRTGIAR